MNGRVCTIPIVSILLVFMLSVMPTVSAAEFSDNIPTLSVVLEKDSKFVYRDSEGYTIVLGQVTNNGKLTSVTDVQIRAHFFDDVNSQPMESVVGSTILEVIPPQGSSPFVIKSRSSDPAITQAAVQLDGFDSSASKQKLLNASAHNLSYADDTLSFSVILQNGAARIIDSTIHMAFYDGFDPPRIVDVRTIPMGSMTPYERSYFEFSEKINKRAVKFDLFAESDVSYSDFTSLTIPAPQDNTKLVTISGVTVRDTGRNSVSDVTAGSTVVIGAESWVRSSADRPAYEVPYTFFAQVKQFGEKPYVEFLGKYDGVFLGAATQSPSIKWVPENAGVFFIETFVWDRDNMPIANQGPIIIVSVK